MKISYLSGSILPSYTANSLQVMKMCQGIAQKGHETTLYAANGNDAMVKSDSDIWQHYAVRKRFEIVRLKYRAYLKGYDVALSSAMLALKRHTDLVYARNMVAAAITSIFGCPTILEMHQIPSGRLEPLWLRMTVSGKGFLRLITITDALKNLMLARYRFLRAKEILVAPDAVDLERFHDLPNPPTARAKLGLSPAFTAGYSGSLYEGRGIEVIMDLACRLPQVQFLIMGGPPEIVASRQERIRIRKVNNLKLFGYIPNTYLPVYLAACDILLMPYQRKVAASGGGDISNVLSPMKLFEYMAMNRPIISSNLPVLLEVINSSNAILCAPDNIDHWQSAIESCVNDTDLCISLAAKAWSDIQQYTWQRRAESCIPRIPQTIAKATFLKME